VKTRFQSLRFKYKLYRYTVEAFVALHGFDASAVPILIDQVAARISPNNQQQQQQQQVGFSLHSRVSDWIHSLLVIN
jgi:hypothetical protein